MATTFLRLLRRYRQCCHQCCHDCLLKKYRKFELATVKKKYWSKNYNHNHPYSRHRQCCRDCLFKKCIKSSNLPRSLKIKVKEWLRPLLNAFISAATTVYKKSTECSGGRRCGVMTCLRRLINSLFNIFMENLDEFHVKYPIIIQSLVLKKIS